MRSRRGPDAIADRSKPRVREVLRDVATGGLPESLRDLADRIAALTPDVRQTDSTELVRADRDR